MKRGFAIVVTLLLVIGVLIALNAASYVKLERTRESELTPDRSTFNAGPTGTQALYDFLRESGHHVARWREAPESLLDAAGSKPSTIVIIGETITPISEEEADALLRWVDAGGRLVIIDRTPGHNLLPSVGDWTVTSHVSQFPFDADPNKLEEMTAGVKPIVPAQPTLLSRDVESVLPSRFAGKLQVGAAIRVEAKPTPAVNEEPDDESADPSESPEESASPAESDDDGLGTGGAAVTKPLISPAPITHFGSEGSGLLVDYPYGKGRIVVLADPFIVANNGIGRADNLQLAVNAIAGYGGLIAFDEFHQGHGTTQNALIQYFAGTPVVAIALQLALIVLVVIWSRGRRFARALPLPQVDRRSSLEFVASMAELQQRARAYDLALENIYGRVRRVLVRHAGTSNKTPRSEVARRVASRSHLTQEELESLMRNCEDVINGAPTNSRRSLDLARRLRRIEAALGLRMRSREAKQAQDKV